MAARERTGAEVERHRPDGIVENAASARQGDLGLFENFVSEVTFRDDDADATYRAMLADLLSAKSIEEALTPPDAAAAADMVGIPLLVSGWSRVDSDYDQGASQYGSIRATRLDTEESVVINTGWQFLLGQLLIWTLFEEQQAAAAEGRAPNMNVPRRIVFREPRKVTIIAASRPNKYGKTPLRLKLLS